MIFVGTDIISISRIDTIIREKGKNFLNHIYTKNEQNICNSSVIPTMHYGGKFAAKEAVKKALLSSKSIRHISLRDIEIQNDEEGAPFVTLCNYNNNIQYIKVSISHVEKYATAIAVLELE